MKLVQSTLWRIKTIKHVFWNWDSGEFRINLPQLWMCVNGLVDLNIFGITLFLSFVFLVKCWKEFLLISWNVVLQVGILLKQFLPQLQTTFLKSLVDPHRQVRLKAAFALSRLVLIHGKADPLFIELHTAIKNTEDSSIK